MQVVALLKVVLLGVAAAEAEDAIGVLKNAGVTQPFWFYRDCCKDILKIGCSKSKKYLCSNEQFMATYSLQLDSHVLLLMIDLCMDYHS